MGKGVGLTVFFWDNVNNLKYVWIILLKMTFWIFKGKLATVYIQVRWENVEAIGVKFSHDLTCQKSLKSVNFWQSYSQNKQVDVFGTQYVYTVGHKKESTYFCLLLRQKSTDFNTVFTVRFKNKRHMWQYELHPPHLINVAALLCEFQRLSRRGSVTAQQSSSERPPNFAALNRGRHLYSAGRPSRWAFADILVCS